MSATTPAPLLFPSIEDVLLIHEDTLLHEGGAPGIRDIGLLKSAVMMPQQVFGGDYLHAGIASMAAAYLFHLASNHPFTDGNKRAAVLTALIFLRANGVAELPAPIELEPTVWAIADGSMTKAQLTEWFRRRVDEATAA